MKKDFLWASGLGLLSSSCCVIQLVLNSLSIGCAGFSALTPYRHFFVGLTSIFLGFVLARDGFSKRTLMTLLIASSLTLTPEIVAGWNQNTFKFAKNSQKILERVIIQVDGPHCEACASSVKSCLLQVPGVTNDTVIKFNGDGRPIEGEVILSAPVSDEQIMAAVSAASQEFNATIIKRIPNNSTS